MSVSPEQFNFLDLNQVLDSDFVKVLVSIVTLWFVYTLGKFRDDRKFLKEKRIEIYSELLSEMATNFELTTIVEELNLIKNLEEKRKMLAEKGIADIKRDIVLPKGRSSKIRQKLRDTELEFFKLESDAIKEIYEAERNLISINKTTRITKLTSKARLVAGKTLSRKLIMLNSLLQPPQKLLTKKEEEKIHDRFIEEKMLIEDLMKEEISGRRDFFYLYVKFDRLWEEKKTSIPKWLRKILEYEL